MIIETIKKATLFKRYLTSSLGILLMSGCSISVPQVESSYNFLRGLMSSDHVYSDEQQVIWLAAVDDRGAVVQPYLSGGLTVFANADGDAIAFDGWVIRSVVGFGLNDPLSISGKEGVRTFSVAGQKTETECDDWHLEGLTWSQTCENGAGEIKIDDKGNIQKITMAIGEGLNFVTLRVAK